MYITIAGTRCSLQNTSERKILHIVKCTQGFSGSCQTPAPPLIYRTERSVSDVSFFDMTSLPEYARSVTTIVFSMFIGVSIAAFISLIYRYYYGSFIRFLLNGNAQDEQSGIRLDKTVYARRPILLHAISQGTLFKNVLRYTEPEETFPLGEKPALKERRKAARTALLTRRYYIPYEMTFRADNLYNKKGTNLFTAIMSVVLFAVVAAMSLIIIPDLLTMLENFINGL